MGHGILSVKQIAKGLNVARAGREIRVLPETGSTNDEALNHAEDRARDGLAVFAEYQTAGRGRLGRRWASPRGASLLCSVLVFLEDTPAWISRVTLIGAISACDAARAAGAAGAEIKWPNDVVVGQRKLGGVLVETRRADEGVRAYAIGIGLNCLQQAAHWPAELRDAATSLDEQSPRPIDRASVARALLEKLDAWLATPIRWDDEALKEAWRQLARPLGSRIHLRSDGREFAGSVIDIDPAAGLIIELDGGGRRLFEPARTTVL